MSDEKSLPKKLGIRRKIKKKKPTFNRQEGYRYKRLKECWRKPRGRHSKLRKSEKPRGKKPSVGYRSPKEVRGLTKSGYKPVLVANKSDLEKIDPLKEAVVIRASVGKKKMSEIVLEAEKMQIKVLNAYKFKFPNTK